MTDTLLNYYAALNASRSARHLNADRRTYGDNPDMDSLAAHPAHDESGRHRADRT